MHIILEGSDGEFTTKKEDFFYEIDINIKLINGLKLDDS